jgi:DNA mismatch repair protein MutH
VRPPRSETELLERARALAGKTLAELARAHGGDLSRAAVRTKGTGGELVERALGATGGSLRAHDFPELGVELKTIPVGDALRPRESTYVCTLPMEDAERAEWDTSWVKAKLARVLWVPLLVADGGAHADRTVGAPLLWSPTPAQEAVLRADFEDALGAIALGHVEALTAHAGTWLQVRPKAKDGSARTVAWSRDGDPIPTTPRGFYLRASFTGAILRKPAALL